MNLNFKLDFFKRSLLFRLQLVKQATHWTTGTLNRTVDGKYVMYLDYDLMKESYIKGELEHLQRVYDLGDIHVFKSSEKGFHAISFVKLTAKEYIELLENSSVDSSFKNVPRYKSYRNWVLRHFEKGNTKKPIYLYTIKFESYREQSQAHFNMISALYPDVQINQPTNSDRQVHLTVIEYPTGSNVG